RRRALRVRDRGRSRARRSRLSQELGTTRAREAHRRKIAAPAPRTFGIERFLAPRFGEDPERTRRLGTPDAAARRKALLTDGLFAFAKPITVSRDSRVSGLLWSARSANSRRRVARASCRFSTATRRPPRATIRAR